jgi:aminoglycoside phosphotransferase (APT) family kinase protein
MPEWTAEVNVDEGLVRRLVGEQFPEIPLESPHLVAEGWDNAVWLVGGQLAFRFPRRAVAVPLLERELAVLPHIADKLPRPIPRPLYAGTPTPEFPWPFLGYRLLPGRELPEANLDNAQRACLGEPLGLFLRALHTDELLARFAEKLPFDANKRADMRVRDRLARARLAEVERLGLWSIPATVDGLLRAARALPPSRTARLIHGDLHAQHILVDESARLAGVIDWGDVGIGDPAIDLQLFWSVLPPEARDDFAAGYGPIPAESLLRARILALFLCATVALYAREEGLSALERDAVGGLERTMSE